MQISVVVVTYNSSADVAALLPTLRPTYPDDIQTTVVVVDNGSSDDTVALAEASPSVDVVVPAENRGYAAGINTGAATAGDFDALLVLNPDVRLHESALETMARALDDPRVGIVAPLLVDEQGALLWSQRREPTVVRTWAAAILGGVRAGRIGRLGELDSRPERYREPHDVDWVTGAAILVSRRCWDAVGPWDERFFLYSEETDYCLRARDAGFATRFVPAAVVSHFEGDMTAPQAAAMRSVNAARLFRKRHGPVATLAFVGGMIAGSLLRFGRASERAAAAALVFPDKRPEQVRRPRLLTRLPSVDRADGAVP